MLPRQPEFRQRGMVTQPFVFKALDLLLLKGVGERLSMGTTIGFSHGVL